MYQLWSRGEGGKPNAEPSRAGCVLTASCLVLNFPGSNWRRKGRIRPKVISLLFLTYLSRRFDSFKQGSSDNHPGQEEAESQVPHDPAGLVQPTRALKSHFAESTRCSREERGMAAHKPPLQLPLGKKWAAVCCYYETAASSESVQ